MGSVAIETKKVVLLEKKNMKNKYEKGLKLEEN
jgi:hypothetical protein